MGYMVCLCVGYVYVNACVCTPVGFACLKAYQGQTVDIYTNIQAHSHHILFAMSYVVFKYIYTYIFLESHSKCNVMKTAFVSVKSQFIYINTSTEMMMASALISLRLSHTRLPALSPTMSGTK